MPYCHECGLQVTGREKFCPDCGSTFEPEVPGSVQVPEDLCCSRCDAPIKDKDEYCPNCGALLLDPSKRYFCSSCGAELRGNFCSKCGKPLTAEDAKKARVGKTGRSILKVTSDVLGSILGAIRDLF